MKTVMKNGKSLFICFIGIDGSGKTSLAKGLVKSTPRLGIKSKYVRCRFESFKLLWIFIEVVKKVLIVSGKKKTDNSPEGTETRRELFKNPFFSRVYENLLFFDYFWQILFKVRLPLAFGKNIICDRYFYDTVIDMAVDFGSTEPEVHKMVSKFLSIAPEPGLVFLVDLPVEVAYRRNLLKSDGLRQDYIAERRNVYLSLGKRREITVLNGAQSLDELGDLIWDEVTGLIGKGSPAHE